MASTSQRSEIKQNSGTKVKRTSFWWSQEDLDLIDFVRESPEIRASAYFVRAKDADIWLAYANKVGKNVHQVRNRWKDIRKSYFYNYKRDGVRASKYKTRSLKFLEEYVDITYNDCFATLPLPSYEVTLDLVQQLLNDPQKKEEEKDRAYVFTQEIVKELISAKLLMEDNARIPILNAIDDVMSKIPEPNLEELLSVENYLLLKRYEMSTSVFFQKVGCFLKQHKNMTAQNRYLFLYQMWLILEKYKKSDVSKHHVNELCDPKSGNTR